MPDQTAQTTEKKRSAGGLWRRKTSQDKTYFSGQIELPGSDERLNFVAFINDYASENERAPAYKIYLSDNQPTKAESPKPKPTAAKPATKPVVKAKVAPKPAPVEVEEDEQIENEEILLD